MGLSNEVCQSTTIINRLGLHARAAGKLVNLTDQFNASITVKKNDQEASGDSIMELMMLTAAKGDQITIAATGPDANEAVQAIINLIQQRFDEET
jgi:phosphocarrier protein HPr